MTKTIARNTKAHAAAFANAKAVKVFSLSNNFDGREMSNPIPNYDIENGKLVRRGDVLSLRVHGNLWYEWAA